MRGFFYRKAILGLVVRVLWLSLFVPTTVWAQSSRVSTSASRAAVRHETHGSGRPAELRVRERRQAEVYATPGNGLRVTGWSLLLSSYGAAVTHFAAAGPLTEDLATASVMLIPVVGPAVAAGLRVNQDYYYEENTFLVVTGFLSSALQLLGLSLALAGHGTRRRHLRQHRRQRVARGSTQRKVRWSASPSGPLGRPGISVSGYFF
jgi:hypothetical protein